mgnify:CR=1 FL=1
MNIVSFGGVTNSAALLIGLYKHKIPIDLITFADTGAEHPHTYQFIEIINQWLAEHGMPQITVVQYTTPDPAPAYLLKPSACALIRSRRLPTGISVVRRNTKSHRRKSFATTMRLAAKYGSAARKSTAISAMTREK